MHRAVLAALSYIVLGAMTMTMTNIMMIRTVKMQCCAVKCTAVMCSLQWVFAHCSPPVIVLDELAGQPGLKMAWCAWLTLQIWQLLYLVSQEQSHVLHPLLACHLQIAMACLLPTSADRCSSTKAGLTVSQAKQQTVRKANKQQSRADIHGKSQVTRSKGQGVGCGKTRATAKTNRCCCYPCLTMACSKL